MNKGLPSIIKKYSLILALGLPLCSSALCTASSLTPAQQQTLNKAEYNVGSLLRQRLRDLERNAVKRQVDELKDGAKEEKTEHKVEEKKPEVPELTLKLVRLDVPDSLILSKEEIESVTSKYNDRVVSIKDLYNAVEELNLMYAKKGYLTARAFLPPQKIEGNVVKVMLIEGRIGKILIENNKATKDKYIRRSINVKEGIVPNMKELQRNIQLFNSTNKTMLQIKMVAGEEPMTTDFYIIAIEPKKTSSRIFTDNSGSESSGEWRYGVSVTDNNITGRCDVVNLTSLFARTSETVLFSYDTPIGYKGLRASVNHSENHVRFSRGEAKILDTRGKSKATGIAFTKPLKYSARRKDELQLDIQKQHSETSILGNSFVNDKEERYSLSYSSMRVKNNSILYWKPAYIHNTHKNIDGDKYNGARFTLDTLWQKYKKSGNNLTLRVSAQKDLDDYIPSADQYYLGGQYSVRGYEENIIGGDAGVNAKLDYSWRTKIKGLLFVTFFDWGRLSGDTILTTKEIYSAGWGIEYIRGRVSASLYTGYALKKHIGDRDIDSSVTNFAMNYLFD